jgi:hypothetical protein
VEQQRQQQRQRGDGRQRRITALLRPAALLPARSGTGSACRSAESSNSRRPSGSGSSSRRRS